MDWSKIKHFTRSEFDSPDIPGSGDNMAVAVVVILDSIRERLGIPLHINSGYRSPAHNADVGGAPGSAHQRGLAVDISCTDHVVRYRLVEAAIRHVVPQIAIGAHIVHLGFDNSRPTVIGIYGTNPGVWL